MEELIQLLNNLASWVNNGSRSMMDKTVKNLAIKYRTQIRAGLNADGSKMSPLHEATLKAPIRRGLSHAESNQTIRESLGVNPLVATGATVDSIQGVKVGSDEWEISSQDIQLGKIMNSNAKTTHSGYPFIGDTSKVVRDPLTVEDPQLDYIEDQIVQDLERILGT